MPWYLKIALALGLGGFAWKIIQGSIPKIIAWLTPLALAAADKTVAFVLAYPLLRSLVLGNEDNAEQFLNALIDGLQSIIDAVQKRVIEDLRAAKATDQAPPPAAP